MKLVLGLLLLGLLLVLGLSLGKNKSPVTPPAQPATGPTHQLRFWEPALFAVATKASEDVGPPEKTITGALVPHHLLPSTLTAEIFKKISYQEPKTIILLGPNHYELGTHKILSSKLGWETTLGPVTVEQGTLDQLEKKGLVHYDDAVLVNEHAIGGLIPFIKLYTPQATVIPLILSKSLTMEELRTLSGALQEFLDRETVLVASVDCSHYQTQAVAEQHDEEILEMMRAKNYPALLSLTSAFVDSPSTLSLFLLTMEARGLDFQVINHSNSGRLQQRPYQEVTSYFTLLF